MYFILSYQTVPNFKEKRKPYRKAHFDVVQAAVKRREILLGGALENPADAALLIFKVETEEIVRQFAEKDPYVKNGLIIEWKVCQWNVLVGTCFEN